MQPLYHLYSCHIQIVLWQNIMTVLWDIFSDLCWRNIWLVVCNITWQDLTTNTSSNGTNRNSRQTQRRWRRWRWCVYLSYQLSPWLTSGQTNTLIFHKVFFTSTSHVNTSIKNIIVVLICNCERTLLIFIHFLKKVWITFKIGNRFKESSPVYKPPLEK